MFFFVFMETCVLWLVQLWTVEYMYTESHFFLQSSKFVYLSAQLLTHFKLFHHILWLLLYINPYPLNRYIKDKKLLIPPLTLVAINMFTHFIYVQTQQN